VCVCVYSDCCCCCFDPGSSRGCCYGHAPLAGAHCAHNAEAVALFGLRDILIEEGHLRGEIDAQRQLGSGRVEWVERYGHRRRRKHRGRMVSTASEYTRR
jgi:hypothetical protein